MAGRALRATIRPMATPPLNLRHRLPALAAALSLFAVACGPATPTATVRPSETAPASVQPSATPTGPAGSPSPAPDPATLYREIEGQVIAIRGLQPKREVVPKVLDDAQLKARIQKSFSEDNPPELIAANERLLKAMGLFPEDASLKDLYLEMLGSAVLGLYSPKDHELYVVARSGNIGVSERVTFSHEFTHALQDQQFDLQGFELSAIGQGDRSLGRLSLIEGDATLSMTLWLQQHLTAAEKVEFVRQSLDPAALGVLEKMPPILRESLGFPYDAGFRFVIALYGAGGWKAVDEAFARPPASTEQVMHPEKYTANEAPLVVDLPDDIATRMGAGWKVGLEDTLGEFQLGVWLRGALNRVAPANDAAAGWGGDRVVLLQGPNNAWAMALATDWDTAADATQFADAAGEALSTLNVQTALGHESGTNRVGLLFASDAATAVQLDAIVGLTGN
jgi:hypothetical protein